MSMRGYVSALSAAAVIAATCLSNAVAKPGFYLSVAEFLDIVFTDDPGDASRLTINADLRTEVEEILGHSFPRIGVEYWEKNDTTAWVLDEIGKTEPITIGVAVEAGRVKSVRVLEFRESRGFEIRYAYFTDQFLGAELSQALILDRSIDSITGATLSVNAVDRVVRTALLLDRHVNSESESRTPASY